MASPTQGDSDPTGASSYGASGVPVQSAQDVPDIVSIASAIVDKVELSNLATCLGVQMDTIDENDTKRDQIVKMLIHWQFKHLSDNSKSKLLECLRKLNNAGIDEALRTYHEIQAPTIEESIQFEFSDIPENESINTDPQQCRIRSNSPFQCAQQSTQENDIPGSQMVMCGQRLDFRAKPELFTKREVTRKIAVMEERFSDLLCDVQEFLKSEANVEAIKLYLTSLSMSIREDVSPAVFSSQQAVIITHSKLTQIFEWLTTNGFWSFLNFYLLERLVDKYGNDNLKIHVNAFKQDMETFKLEMKLVDFLPAWSGRSPHIPASGFEPIILRVNKDWFGCTLADVARLEGFLESRFLINRFLLRFANGHPGSVVIMWLAPSHVIAFLKQRIMAVGTKSLTEVGIIEVKFDDKIVVKASSVAIQSMGGKSLAPANQKGVKVTQPKTLLDHGDYEELYATSINDPEFFWGTLAKQFLLWDKPFDKVMECNMEEGKIKWFTAGRLNVSVNCVDRHASKYPDRVALIWEKDEPEQTERVTYKQLLEKVCQIANVLKSKGVKKGDLVAIYMPICPLAVAAMLACARIGAVHSVLFSRFALVDNGHEQRNKLLKERIAEAKVVITANTTPLNGKILKLKESLDEAVTNSNVKHVLVYKRMNDEVSMKSGRDEFLEEAMQTQPTECKPESMESEDNLFVMFTSGLTGEPKGVLHTQAGYLLHVAVTHKYYFDYKPGEIYACTADIGWITGHSYVVYGPLCNGATTMLFDSTAVYPNASRCWKLVQEHHINQFYTTPSVIQKLMSLDAEIPDSFNLSSLRIIGSVGECLKPEAWKWFHRRFGNSRCPVIDTWWQTELGGIALSPHPHQKPLDCKNGMSMKPSFGVIPCLIDKEIEQTNNDVTGKLYLEAALPGMGRRLTGDNGYELFREEYFKCYEERTLFYTSDIVHRNREGGYQIYGRFGDAIRYQGELLNLPVIEGAANSSHESIEDTLLVTQEKQNTSEEPNVLALVKVKRSTSPAIEKEVIMNVQQIIEETTPIQKDKLEVKTHKHNTCITFSGKTLRQPLKNKMFEQSCHNSKSMEMASRMMPPCLVG